jgi:epoxyqueuosine reductase
MDRVLSARDVRSAAHACQFVLVGFSPAAPLDSGPLSRWLAAGYSADLAAMHRKVAERLDPGAVVPNARTVIALAIPYGDQTASHPSPIARYARGRDYHYAHRDRMRHLRHRLLEMDLSMRTYACVDAGMAMEKAWAERAGLGWIGKHGLLITREYGSWLTLSIMIIDRALDDYDQPHPRQCGDCDLCLRACPTGAFPAAGVLDARRCLAYHTVENRASIPEDLRESLAGRVFGCDACQEACPHNRRDLPPGDTRQAPRPISHLDAAALSTLSSEEFAALAGGTPLIRAGHVGIRRNAVLSLGAERRQDARSLLERLALDPEALVAEAALWALARL